MGSKDDNLATSVPERVERLQFVPRRGAADPDEAIMGQAVLDQVSQKLKELVGKGDAHP